jgi:hypothetical protein
VKIVDGLVVDPLDRDPGAPLSGAPLWALGPELAPLLEDLPGPPFELVDAFRRALERGLRITGIEIGRTRDLTHPADLVHENVPYLAR